MKLYRLLVIFIIHLIIGTDALSQSLTGIIKTKSGETLVGASIVAKTDNGNIISYCISNEKGLYKLSIPKEVDVKSANVCFSFIGFKKKNVPLSLMKDGMTIILEENNFKIKEIKVSAQRIKHSRDTLTYSVAGFRQGQDRTLANVIAKMPGLEVKSDGQISYQGKEINKFYIEGLDLMGGEYGIANQNISADKVKSVQVLENHQTVKSLRGVSFSDQAALNIVLKDNAKAVWAGSADIGVGYGDDFLYDCRLMGMHFEKKHQTLMMYKNNNKGKRLNNEVIDIDAILNGRIAKEPGILSLSSIEIPALNECRYTFNNSHLIAGNWLWKTGTDSELRIQGNGLIDKTDMQNYNSTTYLNIAGLPVITEEQDITNRYSEWRGEINFQYNGDRTYIKNNIKGYVDFNKSSGCVLYNNNAVNRMVKPHKRNFSENFILSKTTKNGNIFNIDSYLLYNSLPGQLLTINNNSEKLDLGFLSSQNNIKYKIKLGKHYLNNNIGVDYHHQDIGERIDENEKLSNVYNFLRVYWSPSMSFVIGRQHLDMKLRLSHARQKFEKSSSRHFWIDPSLFWNWKVSAVSEFSANLNYSNLPVMCKSLYNTAIFTDYMTKKKNRGITDSQQALYLSTAYKYSNPIAGLFFNLRPMYRKSYGNMLYKSGLENNIFSLIATDKKYNMQTVGLSARISKSFSWAKAVVGLGITHNITDYKLLLADDVDKARMNFTLLSLDYSLRPIRQLSVEGKSGMDLFKQQNRTHKNLSSGSVTDWRHSLNIHFFPADKLMFSLNNSLHHTNEDGVGANYFLDLNFSYKLKRWELALLANNVIGTSVFERRILGNTVESYSITKLRPREFLAKISVDI